MLSAPDQRCFRDTRTKQAQPQAECQRRQLTLLQWMAGRDYSSPLKERPLMLGRHQRRSGMISKLMAFRVVSCLSTLVKRGLHLMSSRSSCAPAMLNASSKQPCNTQEQLNFSRDQKSKLRRDLWTRLQWMMRMPWIPTHHADCCL